jgi:hypothetical protein
MIGHARLRRSLIGPVPPSRSAPLRPAVSPAVNAARRGMPSKVTTRLSGRTRRHVEK